MNGLVKSWSFSRWGDYQQCPRKFKLKVLDRIPEPPNPAVKRGMVLHKMAELYVRGEKITRANLKDDRGGLLCTASEFPVFHNEWRAALASYREQFDERREGDCEAEAGWAFTQDWQGEARGNDWANAWVRIKVDCYSYGADTETGRVIDWKTGKRRDSHRDQLSLYAI